jgi:hypothetical protein
MKLGITATTITTIAAAVIAALSFLPYGWAHIAAGAISAALVAVHGSATVAAKSASKGI